MNNIYDSWIGYVIVILAIRLNSLQGSSTMQHILMVLSGSRSSAKMIPLYLELEKRGYRVSLALPHQKDPLIDQLTSSIDYPRLMTIPAELLNDDFTNSAFVEINKLFETSRPSLVLLEGENNTTICTAFAAYCHKIPIAHIEAGTKRTSKMHCKTQKLLNLLSSYHFTSTSGAAAQLLAQGVKRDAVFSIGNLVQDLIKIIQSKIGSHDVVISDSAHESISYAQAQGYKRLLVSFNHNRTEEELETIFSVLKQLLATYQNLCILFGGDQNYLVDKSNHTALYTHDRFFICSLKNFADEIYALQATDIVLTDSMSLQEESLCFAKPVLFMQSSVDSVEGIWAGLTYLTPVTHEKIINGFALLEKKPRVEDTIVAKESNAASKIVDVINRITRNIPIKSSEKVHHL